MDFFGPMSQLPPAMRKPVSAMLAEADQTIADHKADRNTLPDPMQQVVALAARLLGSKDAKPLLEHLADQTVRKRMELPPVGTPPDQQLAYVQRRAGQNDLFEYLIQLIQLGKQQGEKKT